MSDIESLIADFDGNDVGPILLTNEDLIKEEKHVFKWRQVGYDFNTGKFFNREVDNGLRKEEEKDS